MVGTPLHEVTGTTGRFRIDGVSGAQVTLWVMLIGYQAVEQPVRAGAKEARE